ncbi:MAG: HD domain-containing protein [Clostridia bacterium]|nr:HD domain-containing protein [Clostridia bacterium]
MLLPYQVQYIDNCRTILELHDLHRHMEDGFNAWYASRQSALFQIHRLREENHRLLRDYLFPTLDTLYSADADTLSALNEFADALMDWTTNLDCGLYVQIHDAMLSLARIQKDRCSIIQELYKLGMGLYYRNRMVSLIDRKRTHAILFQNEMVFTEAASYFPYFPQMPKDETKGYVLRSLANISICTSDLHRRIASSHMILQIVQDPYYRSMAPSLPWDTFLRRTHQQMSSNRTEMSSGDLTKEELALVLESCYEVYKPETASENPSVRWLWPYYEMEYNCGLVDIQKTLVRMKTLIEDTREDDFTMSGLYAHVQLPMYMGMLLKNHPGIRDYDLHMRFLSDACQKMLRILLVLPTQQIDDYLHYLLTFIIAHYWEAPGLPSYHDVLLKIMQRFAGMLYLHSRRTGDIAQCLCEELLATDPAFFDDIPHISILSGVAKKTAVMQFAFEGALFHDLGKLPMNTERLFQKRQCLEEEAQIECLHTVSAYDFLSQRPSTARFADIALGHHRWYNGADGYPVDYVRNASPYRQMTDVLALADYLAQGTAAWDHLVRDAKALGGTRFSPLVTACLMDQALLSRLQSLVSKENDMVYYREIYDSLTPSADTPD